MTSTRTVPVPSPFGGSRTCFEDIVGWLDGTDAGSMSHSDLEEGLDQRGRELLRRLLQDHLDLRARREERVEVQNVDGVRYGSVEPGHTRQLSTVFGVVSVERLAYRHRGATNLHPADATLNLPEEKHSHGLRRLAALESSRGSYDDTAEAILRATGVLVAKRQVEELADRAAVDVDEFYKTITREPAGDEDVLVVSVDGKGIVMRPNSLRPATERAAAAATTKLECRLSKGELWEISHNSPYGSAGVMRKVRSRSRDVRGQGYRWCSPLSHNRGGLIDPSCL